MRWAKFTHYSLASVQDEDALLFMGMRLNLQKCGMLDDVPNLYMHIVQLFREVRNLQAQLALLHEELWYFNT